MKIHAFIYHNVPSDYESAYVGMKPYITAWPSKVDDNDRRTFIAEMDLEADGLTIPTNEQIIAKRIAIMREQIKEIKSRSFIETKNIEDKIQQLLCLENKEQ